MSVSVATLTPYSANRFVFLFSIAAIGAAAIYFGYGAVNRLGLSIQEVDATVVDKQRNPSRNAYTTVIAGGRPWVQVRETSETYVVVLQVGGEKTGGLVSQDLYETLKTGDMIRAKIRRTRISRKLEAIEITKT